jgi:thiamine pyrophosphate-dependent acetolactate synthase large subunit-like protein
MIPTPPDELAWFIQVRHEEMAGLMACAIAKFTGEVGVCIATSGPGAVHLLNGLYDATNLDHQPVLALVSTSNKAGKRVFTFPHPPPGHC